MKPESEEYLKHFTPGMKRCIDKFIKKSKRLHDVHACSPARINSDFENVAKVFLTHTPTPTPPSHEHVAKVHVSTSRRKHYKCTSPHKMIVNVYPLPLKLKIKLQFLTDILLQFRERSPDLKLSHISRNKEFSKYQSKLYGKYFKYK